MGVKDTLLALGYGLTTAVGAFNLFYKGVTDYGFDPVGAAVTALPYLAIGLPMSAASAYYEIREAGKGFKEGFLTASKWMSAAYLAGYFIGHIGIK